MGGKGEEVEKEEEEEEKNEERRREERKKRRRKRREEKKRIRRGGVGGDIPRQQFPLPHTWRPSGPSVCLGDDLPSSSQVTAKMLPQQQPDTHVCLPAPALKSFVSVWNSEQALVCMCHLQAHG